MISRNKVQMFSYDQLFQAYQKDKFVLVSCYRLSVVRASTLIWIGGSIDERQTILDKKSLLNLFKLPIFSFNFFYNFKFALCRNVWQMGSVFKIPLL